MRAAASAIAPSPNAAGAAPWAPDMSPLGQPASQGALLAEGDATAQAASPSMVRHAGLLHAGVRVPLPVDLTHGGRPTLEVCSDARMAGESLLCWTRRIKSHSLCFVQAMAISFVTCDLRIIGIGLISRRVSVIAGAVACLHAAAA